MGEADGLIPDSDAFRLEWESYLAKNFNSVDAIKNRWLMADTFQSIQQLARLIPLWKGDQGIPFDRGFPYLFDPATGTALRKDHTEFGYSIKVVVGRSKTFASMFGAAGSLYLRPFTSLSVYAEAILGTIPARIPVMPDEIESLGYL